MQTSLVMTIIGQDRPGLVESVARVVAQNGGNWLESRMSRLGGHFAGILRVEVSAGNQQRLASALQALNAGGLTIVVHPDQAAEIAAAARLTILEIVGQDRPGIVNQITHALAEHKVNVEELETECASAAMSGETLFKALAILSIPDSASAVEIRK